MVNSVKTAFLLALLFAVFMYVGRALAGPNGLVMGFMFALVLNGISYWFSDKIVLAMYRARPVQPGEMPWLEQMVAELADKAGLPKPRLYVIPTATPNAFATGRNPRHAAVAVTEGILRLLDREELRGVLAHELSHVRHRDVLIGTVAAVLAGTIMFVANIARWAFIFGGYRSSDEREGGGLGALLLIILAPLAAMLIQMAISRSREYHADAQAARLTGTPEGLARALEKLAYGQVRGGLPAHPSTAHLFIVNPLRGEGLASLFSTHPPVEKRIARLRSLRV